MGVKHSPSKTKTFAIHCHYVIVIKLCVGYFPILILANVLARDLHREVPLYAVSLFVSFVGLNNIGSNRTGVGQVIMCAEVDIIHS